MQEQFYIISRIMLLGFRNATYELGNDIDKKFFFLFSLLFLYSFCPRNFERLFLPRASEQHQHLLTLE